jgi:phosphoglycolate phosphatase
MKSIKAVGFDWDGTLVDNMSVKAQSFGQTIVESYPALAGLEEDVSALYLATAGIPREAQLTTVEERYHLTPLTASARAAWSTRFTQAYSAQTPPLFPDALSTLESLDEGAYHLFISSGVPIADLIQHLNEHPAVEHYMQVILGSQDDFVKGKPHIQYVANKLHLSPEEILFVGDAIHDVQCAREAGCMSAAKFTTSTYEALAEQKPDILVPSLAMLLHYLP